MSDKEWADFVAHCKNKWPNWSPDKISIELWLEWSNPQIPVLPK